MCMGRWHGGAGELGRLWVVVVVGGNHNHVPCKAVHWLFLLGRERALAFSGGFVCVCRTVTTACRPQASSGRDVWVMPVWGRAF